MNRLRALLIWAILATILAVPLLAAAASPLLQWRQPIYIAAGFAGITAMALLLLQPLLAGGYLPGAEGLKGRRLHRWTGSLLVLAIILHVGGLWITSPPDVIAPFSSDHRHPFPSGVCLPCGPYSPQPFLPRSGEALLFLPASGAGCTPCWPW